jgi:hypothetical protein
LPDTALSLSFSLAPFSLPLRFLMLLVPHALPKTLPLARSIEVQAKATETNPTDWK